MDFNVPGKRNPAPINVTATVWTGSYQQSTGTIEKYAIVFTDPTGTLVSASAPLYTWVQLENFTTIANSNEAPKNLPKKCIEGSPLVFKDMHYGDNKLVMLRGNQVTIMPSNLDERLSTYLSAMPYP